MSSPRRRGTVGVLVLLLIALGVCPASAAITQVQQACNTTTNTSSIVITFAGATTAGNAVAVTSATFSTNRDISSIADGNGGETWVEPANGDVTFGSPVFNRQHTQAAIIVTGSTTVTVTYSGSLGGDGYACAIEFAGNDAADINDDATKDGIQSSSTTFDTLTGGISSGTLTTTNANAILIGQTLAGGGGTIACDASYTTVRSVADHAVCYKIVSSTGSYGITNTTGSGENGSTQLSAFDGTAGGGGGGGRQKDCLLLGQCLAAARLEDLPIEAEWVAHRPVHRGRR